MSASACCAYCSFHTLQLFIHWSCKCLFSHASQISFRIHRLMLQDKQCRKSSFVSSAQQSMLGLKLPSCCLNTLPALIQISFTFRSALSPLHCLPCRLVSSSNIAQPVCTTAVSPLLLCPANNGPVCGEPAFVTLWAQLGAC